MEVAEVAERDKGERKKEGRKERRKEGGEEVREREREKEIFVVQSRKRDSRLIQFTPTSGQGEWRKGGRGKKTEIIPFRNPPTPWM